MQDDIIDAGRPIIDPHHHLWDRRRRTQVSRASVLHLEAESRRDRASYYLLDELLQDIGCGHNVRATVFVECRSMYRVDGPEPMRWVGETEFANGVAAMSASGIYGAVKVNAGIIGHVDFRLGDDIEPVLQAHVAAGGGRFRGIRQWAAQDSDSSVLGPLSGLVPPGLYLDSAFRKGFALLGKLGLTFDAWVLEPQLAEVVDLAKSFPQTQIILDHVGTPVGRGVYQGKREQRFDHWKRSIKALSACDNVVVKLGGLGMACCGFQWTQAEHPASSALARAWAPYIETCIDAFTPERCMFESNFPVDSFTCDYRTLWNALKRIGANYSDAEKDSLFFGTAARVYKLDVKS